MDTVIAAYTGSSVDALTPVASNADDGWDSIGAASVSFAATNGTTYYVAVDTEDAQRGLIQFNWYLDRDTPANDDFADAQIVTGDSGTLTADPTFASREPGEPDHGDEWGGASLWYAWTAPDNGRYQFDTFGSDWDTIMGVYTGSAVDDLTVVVSNDDHDDGSSGEAGAAFLAVGGTTYYIAVDAFQYKLESSITLNWQLVSDIWYVDANAIDLSRGTGDGISWETAFTDLQDAFAAAAPGDHIWVAEGVYVPGASRASTFQLPEGVTVLGGFAGGELSADERDFEEFETVLSGDILDDDAPGFANRTDNCYHVVSAFGTDRTAVLDGFTILGGYADDEPGVFPDDRGAGIFVHEAGATIRDCFIYDNYATNEGGGMQNSRSSALVENCYFYANEAGVWGGGTHTWQSPDLEILSCQFDTNVSVDGGGMSHSDSQPAVTSCDFYFNGAFDSGAGAYNWDSTVSYTDCYFESNLADVDGGAATAAGTSEVTFTDCEFVTNDALDDGGALDFDDDTMATITGGSFVDNIAGDQGGAVESSGDGTVLVVSDVLFRGNRAHVGGGLFVEDASVATVADASFDSNTAENKGGAIGIQNVPAVMVTDSSFSGNRANDDGGAVNADGGTFDAARCAFSRNIAGDDGGAIQVANCTATVVNAYFFANRANESGGGVATDSGGVTLVDSCSLAGNRAGFGGGAGVEFGGTLTIVSSILWGNTAETGAADLHVGTDSTAAVTHSTVSGGFAGDGNITGDPLFVDIENGLLQLLPTSPCIDAGTNVDAPDDDVDSASRPVGDGHDMGCFEMQQTPIILIADISAAEADGAANVPVYLAWSDGSEVTVDYVTAPGTAVASADYVHASGSLTWAAGTEGARTVSVALVDDGEREAAEWLSVALANAEAASIVDAEGTVTVVSGDTIYVNGAPGPARSGDGMSWETAYTELQDALAAADDGDSIWVAAGVYSPGSERPDSFHIDKSISIYGGFAGGEAAPELRPADDGEHATVLSGDVNSDDIGDTAFSAPTRDDNNEHVVDLAGAGNHLVLDRLTVIGGHADGAGWPANLGGGIRSMYADLTLNDCQLVENTAGNGGGLASYGGVLTLSKTTATACLALNNGGGFYIEEPAPGSSLSHIGSSDCAAGFGGGLNIYDSEFTLPVANSLFSHNSATSEAGGVLVDEASVHFTNCQVRDNYAADFAGGVEALDAEVLMEATVVAQNISDYIGGGICAYSSTLSITDSSVSQNMSAERGGGICMSTGTLDIAESVVAGNMVGLFAEAVEAGEGGGIDAEYAELAISRTTLIGNLSTGTGAAVYLRLPGTTPAQFENVLITANYAESGSALHAEAIDASRASAGVLELVNCTVAENDSDSEGAGAIHSVDVPVFVRNSTVYDNRAAGAGSAFSGAATLDLAYSIVEGGEAGTRVTSTSPGFLDAIAGIADSDPIADDNLYESTISDDTADWVPDELVGGTLSIDGAPSMFILRNTASTVTVVGDVYFLESLFTRKAARAEGPPYEIRRFAIAADGAAVDAGTDDDAPASDIAGTARPQGRGIDIGAFETDVPTDTDGDGMPDDWEDANGTNSTVADATADPDGDGYNSLLEYHGGSDPQDGDSVPDTPGAGGAIELNGTNEYVAVPELLSTPPTALTCEAWVAPAHAEAMQRIFFHGGNGEFTLLFDGNGFAMIVKLADETLHGVQVNGSVTLGAWQHVTGIWQRGVGVELYINGSLAGSVSVPDQPLYAPGSAFPAAIGSYTGTQEFLAGSIDEVRIWSTAHSEQTIRAWMNRRVTPDHPSYADLLAGWSFDENDGVFAHDQSGSGNSARIMGGEPEDVRVLSPAPIGDQSNTAFGTDNLVANDDVPVDVTWSNDAGAFAALAALQSDQGPAVTTGLLASHADGFWQIWLGGDDGDFTADAEFGFAQYPGIHAEDALSLYTRESAGDTWSLVEDAVIDTQGNTTDGVGTITAPGRGAFSQFILSSSDPLNSFADTGEDLIAPVLESITTDAPDGAYSVDAEITVEVTFSEPVDLVGAGLELTLNSGVVLTVSPFVSAASASAVYTVSAAEDTPLLTVTDVALSSGATLQDASGNDAQLFLPAGANLADAHSIELDTIAPTAGTVFDGDVAETDIDVQNATDRLAATWSGFSDDGSGIARYEVAIGSSPGATDMQGFATLPATADAAVSGTLALELGGDYYVSVRATDSAGNASDTIVSDGVFVLGEDFACPGEIAADTVNPEGAIVYFDFGGELPAGLICVPDSGDVFPIGRTAVECFFEFDGPAREIDVAIACTFDVVMTQIVPAELLTGVAAGAPAGAVVRVDAELTATLDSRPATARVAGDDRSFRTGEAGPSYDYRMATTTTSVASFLYFLNQAFSRIADGDENADNNLRFAANGDVYYRQPDSEAAEVLLFSMGENNNVTVPVANGDDVADCWRQYTVGCRHGEQGHDRRQRCRDDQLSGGRRLPDPRRHLAWQRLLRQLAVAREGVGRA
jgi:hypothetical protein